MSVTKPFLKWLGGKTQIIDDVLKTFPTTMNDYYEPFLGGGSVLLALLSRKDIEVKGMIYASDVNEPLISLYKNIQTRPLLVIKEVEAMVEQLESCDDGEVNRKASSLEEATTSRESYYFWIRSQYNSLKNKKTAKASAMFLFLNKTCFRGVYREGPNGFNVPYGNYKNPCVLSREHILTVSRLITNVVFSVSSFSDAIANVTNEDFVYLDPPYAPKDDTSFVSYTRAGFSKESHEELFSLCHNMREREVKFVLSNANVAIVRDAFPPSDYVTLEISCKRAINSKNPSATADEVLVLSI